MLALCWRCGGSLVALHNTKCVVPGSNLSSGKLWGHARYSNCTIKLLKCFSKFFKFNIYQPTSSKGKLKNTFVAVSVHKYEGGADKCRLLSLLSVSSTGRRGAGGRTWHCPCHADRPWLVIYTRKKIREGGGGGEGGCGSGWSDLWRKKLVPKIFFEHIKFQLLILPFDLVQGLRKFGL